MFVSIGPVLYACINECESEYYSVVCYSDVSWLWLADARASSCNDLANMRCMRLLWPTSIRVTSGQIHWRRVIAPSGLKPKLPDRLASIAGVYDFQCILTEPGLPLSVSFDSFSMFYVSPISLYIIIRLIRMGFHDFITIIFETSLDVYV